MASITHHVKSWGYRCKIFHDTSLAGKYDEEYLRLVAGPLHITELYFIYRVSEYASPLCQYRRLG